MVKLIVLTTLAIACFGAQNLYASSWTKINDSNPLLSKEDCCCERSSVEKPSGVFF